MQAQVREAVYWPSINADIAYYVQWCSICTKYKVSSPAQLMLPRGIPDGLWQEIAADYFQHKGREYLLICDLFIKYPFLSKVSSKSTYSLSQKLQELISQYRPSLLHLHRQALPSRLMISQSSCSDNTSTIPSLHPHLP